MNIRHHELPLSELRHSTDPAEFTFRTTDELLPAEEIIGQTRGVKAIEFGLSIQDPGYNIFVSGIPGTGKNMIVKSIMQRVAALSPAPDDWCYLYNFHDPERPRAVNFEPGRGREFRRDMERFIKSVKTDMSAAFGSGEYEKQKSGIAEKTKKKKESLFLDLSQQALDLDYGITSTPAGVVKVGLREGRPLAQEDIADLPPDERRGLTEREEKVDAAIRNYQAGIRLVDKEAKQNLEGFTRSAARLVTTHHLEALKRKYGENSPVQKYLSDLEEDIFGNIHEFLGQEPASPAEAMDKTFFQDRYKVNLLVDNSETRGAPIVEELHPTYANLIGRIDRRARFGAVYTNFTMIRSGAISKANGGYLILNALDLLSDPQAWQALKRIIRRNEITIEEAGERAGLGAGSMKPEPIPVALKIIMIGSPSLYHTLYYLDEDFKNLFKVRSDFDTQIKSSSEEKMRYARFVGSAVKNNKLLPFDRNGVASVVDHAVRLAGKKEKLSLRFSELLDLMREASHWARQAGRKIAGKEDVDKALDEKMYRGNLIDERIQELFSEGTIMVDVTGKAPGQVNGLSVYETGEYSFGKPCRITARVYLGKAGVIDIEREAKLSGRIYNKGVFILSGYLGGTYAQDKPLSLSASVAFEQSYGDVEGDSASAAELIALLSSIADVSVKQGLAVTGSINQKGEIQPIGRVNEKIEGFFAVCRNRGLSGDQGVVIPAVNVKNLMLNKDVVEAVRDGRFHVYAVRTVNEALELLTGMPAGSRSPVGFYPEGTVNYLVEKRLREMSRKLRADAKGEEKKERKEQYF